MECQVSAHGVRSDVLELNSAQLQTGRSKERTLRIQWSARETCFESRISVCTSARSGSGAVRIDEGMVIIRCIEIKIEFVVSNKNPPQYENKITVQRVFLFMVIRRLDLRIK